MLNVIECYLWSIALWWSHRSRRVWTSGSRLNLEDTGSCPGHMIVFGWLSAMYLVPMEVTFYSPVCVLWIGYIDWLEDHSWIYPLRYRWIERWDSDIWGQCDVQSEGRTKFDLVYRVSTAPLCVVHGFFCADSILRGDSTVKLPDDMFCCHSLFENICICIGEIGCCKDIRFDFVSIVVVPFCPFTFLFFCWLFPLSRWSLCRWDCTLCLLFCQFLKSLIELTFCIEMRW